MLIPTGASPPAALSCSVTVLRMERIGGEGPSLITQYKLRYIINIFEVIYFSVTYYVINGVLQEATRRLG